MLLNRIVWITVFLTIITEVGEWLLFNATDLYKVSEWLLFNAKWVIVQIYNGENKLHFDEMIMMISALYWTNKFSACTLKQRG